MCCALVDGQTHTDGDDGGSHSTLNSFLSLQSKTGAISSTTAIWPFSPLSTAPLAQRTNSQSQKSFSLHSRHRVQYSVGLLSTVIETDCSQFVLDHCIRVAAATSGRKSHRARTCRGSERQVGESEKDSLRKDDTRMNPEGGAAADSH